MSNRTSQVTAADHTNQTDETYTYDSAGNRTISGYTTGANNRLLSDGVFNFTYDDEGNRIAQTRISNDPADDKTTEYAWDYRNRLTQVVEKNNAGAVTQSILYVYDVWDRRIEKTFDADGAGSGVAVVTRWAYDGQNVLLTVDATGLVTHRYLYGPDGQVLADDYIGAEKFFPLADNLGTVRDILDHTGAVRNHIDYNAFGRVTSETTAAFDFLFGYTGFERDEETGLLHSDTRYYDAVHARWTQEDWDVFKGGDYNLNRYVGNKATNFIDPNGREEEPADYSPSLDGYYDRLKQLGPTRAGSGREFAGQRIRGRIHVGNIEVAIYEEVADQLENLVWELASFGGGLCAGAAIEIVGGWIRARRVNLVINGQTADITDQFKKLEAANPDATPAELKQALDEILPSIIGYVPDAKKWLRNGGRVLYHPDGSMTYIKNGVSIVFNARGFPDFSRYLYRGADGLNEVTIKLSGKRTLDEDAANAAAGFLETPDGYVWHHHEDLGRMQLVEECVHGDFWHRGGFSLNKVAR